MKIREATAFDSELIRNLHLDAFGKEDGSAVSKLAIDLLVDETAKPLLALIAENETDIVGSIIGSIMFSTVKVKGSEEIVAYILAPLAVASTCQRKGVGRALIERGLQMLKDRSTDLVFVLGDPKYYSRYGFSHNHHFSPPYELPYREAWMVIELKERAFESANGQILCARSLNSPEHW
ncbi:MAG: GNAT family N-acetyltransferase [Pseudanabaena sp.]